MLVAVLFGRLVVVARSPGTAAIWRKIHGLCDAARPIMTASQPVSRHHPDGVLRRDDVAVADHRDLHRGLDFRDAAPVGLAGVALLARARVQRDGVHAAVLGHPGQLHVRPVRGRSSRRGT